MTPVFGREVIEGQQYVAILLQAVASRCVLRAVLFNEFIERFVRTFLRFCLPDFVQVAFRFGLNALGHLVENIGRLVNPAALLTSLGENLADRTSSARSRDIRPAPRSILSGLQALRPSAPANTAFYWRRPPVGPSRECRRPRCKRTVCLINPACSRYRIRCTTDP